MYNPETFGLVMYPRLCSSNGPASDKFKDALLAELQFDIDNDSKKLYFAVETYYEAMCFGNIEAGVNLLGILMMANFNSFFRGTNSRKKMKGRTHEIIKYLSAFDHPIVRYYEALTKLCINGKGSEDWDMMDALAAEGNEYASALIKSYEEYEAELAE